MANASVIPVTGIRGIAQKWAREAGGGVLALCALGLLAALVSYNPRDPSFDTASSYPVTNVMGATGAYIADPLLQIFGVASLMPILAMLAWSWRIMSRRGIRLLPLRVIALFCAMPLWASTISAFPVAMAWPTPSGLGGAMGQGISQICLGAGHRMLGPPGMAMFWIANAAVATFFTVLAFGLSQSEWQAAGAGARDAARVAATGGRSRAIGLLARLAARRNNKRAMSYVFPNYSDQQYAQPAPRAQPAKAPARVRLSTSSAPEIQEMDADYDLPPIAPASMAPTPAVQQSATPQAKISKALIALRPQPAPRADMYRAPETHSDWEYPSLALLKPAPAQQGIGPTESTLRANAQLLEKVLDDYGVQGVIRDIRPGPVVTLYELEPAPGIRSSRVIGLADDIARSLSVVAVRIATVPGRNVIGIEVPNAARETVFLSELLGSPDWAGQTNKLPLALGKDISGSPVMVDLARMPHLLIAGTTGSGKSVGVNAMILSLLYRLSPDECRLIMIDPKMLELSVYDGIPHLMAPVVTEPAKAITALKWTVREMERRYRAMSQLSVRNIGGYNDRVMEAMAKGESISRRVQTGFDEETNRPVFEDQTLPLEKLPFIVVVIDEVADLMMVAGKDIEAAVQRLAQMARAAGIHVIMATQRPSVDVITGTIKANFPTRISFQVISKFDSRTILGEQGAEQLLGQGDMLYMAGGSRIVRVHGPFVADREVEEIVNFLRSQGEPSYIDDVTEAPEDESGASGLSGIAGASEGEQSLFDQAVALVAREGKASTSFVQRHLNIGYNRAAKLIEQMEKEGIISAANHVGKREVLTRRMVNEDF